MSRRISLEQLNIASPCPKSWEDMHRAGDARRFCDHCQKHVHDLSLMSMHDAERLICESAGKGVCVRMSRDDVGRLITLDYAPAPARCARWKTWGPIAAAVAVAGTISAFMFGSRAVANPPLQLLGAIAAPGPVKGKIAVPTPMMGTPAPIRTEMGDIAIPATQPATQPATLPSDAPAIMGEIYIPPATQPQ